MGMRRSDLAVEAREIWAAEEGGEPAGVTLEKRQRDGFPAEVVRVTTQAGARAIGKSMGTYVTVDLSDLLRRAPDALERGARAIAGELAPLLPPGGGTVLVVGLGNRAITPDAVGPLCLRHVLVTRHLVEELPQHFGMLRPVSALAAGVLGDTGVESGELAAAVVERLRPACVIAVDALASRSLERLCRTVQLSDAGIAPGSGVGNHRRALDRETLGVPVIALGVPTVVDGATLALDLLEGAPVPPGVLGERGRDLFVTPREIDVRVADAARLVGYAINLALQPGLSWGDMETLLS